MQYVRKNYYNEDINIMECNKVETVSHPDSLIKSFKVEMCYIDKTKVLSEDFGPQGIECRLW